MVSIFIDTVNHISYCRPPSSKYPGVRLLLESTMFCEQNTYIINEKKLLASLGKVTHSIAKTISYRLQIHKVFMCEGQSELKYFTEGPRAQDVFHRMKHPPKL